jgi:hypothetical protein
VTEHTPLPWKHSRKSVYVSDINHNCLAQMLRGQDENEANAAFIVNAVNSHDALVKALQVARARIEYLGAACLAARHYEANEKEFLPAIDAVLNGVVGAGVVT